MLRRSLCRFSDPASALKQEVEAAVAGHNAMLKGYDFLHAFIPKMVYSTPMAVLLGNHSAGKSTLVNSLVSLDEQKTGVAPTDDSFTVIQSGQHDLDEDGATAVSNPKNKMQDLKSFGQNFTNHLRIKTRRFPDEAQIPDGMMIVDSPGMIDAPSLKEYEDPHKQHRGYDFLGVTKWFAQRADVILLMFDPANPGTTSETLQVLTKSLAGQEHKFIILFNKVDQFDKVTDFARAYGALCWNLSKVISTKDIPVIYTTYTDTGRSTANSAVPVDEMTRNRTDVINIILNSPLRRYDNLLTECEEAALRIHLTCQVAGLVRAKYQRFKWARFGVMGLAACAVPALVSSALMAADLAAIVATASLAMGAVAVTSYICTQQIQEHANYLRHNIDEVFEEVYIGNDRTQELDQRWEKVKPQMKKYMDSSSLDALPSTSGRELRRIMNIVNTDIPQLRRKVDEFKVAHRRKERKA